MTLIVTILKICLIGEPRKRYDIKKFHRRQVMNVYVPSIFCQKCPRLDTGYKESYSTTRKSILLE